jgi:hypothetical protein
MDKKMKEADYQLLDTGYKGVTAPFHSAVSPQGILHKACHHSLRE